MSKMIIKIKTKNMKKSTKWIIGIVAAIIVMSIASTCGDDTDKKQETTQHPNESRKIDASTLKLKGTHASWFKVEEPVQISLVKTNDKGWEVRSKITFTKTKDIDTKKYQAQLQCCQYIDYVDDFEVELITGQYSNEEFNTLLAKSVGDSEAITLKPFQWEGMSYEKAKNIYDKLCGVIINGVEFEKVEKAYQSTSSTNTLTTYEEAINSTVKTYEDIIDDAMENYEEVIDEEIEAYEDAVNKAIDAYEEALDDIFGF